MSEFELKSWTSESVTADLERAIHEHRLPPGTKLGEDELGEAYGISRTIVRAALRRRRRSSIRSMLRFAEGRK